MSARPEQIAFDPTFSQSEILREFYSQSEESGFYARIIHQIIIVCGRHRKAYPTNEQLASIVGCCTKTIQRAINKAHAEGIIRKTSWYDRHNQKRLRTMYVKWRKLRRKLGLKPPVRKKMNTCPNTHTKVLLGETSSPNPPETDSCSALEWPDWFTIDQIRRFKAIEQ